MISQQFPFNEERDLRKLLVVEGLSEYQEKEEIFSEINSLFDLKVDTQQSPQQETNIFGFMEESPKGEKTDIIIEGSLKKKKKI